MAQIKVTDQASGEFGIYSLDTLEADLHYYGMPADETQAVAELAAALRTNLDYAAIERLSIQLGMDVEWV